MKTCECVVIVHYLGVEIVNHGLVVVSSKLLVVVVDFHLYKQHYMYMNTETRQY
jgi:hypothetical protein